MNTMKTTSALILAVVFLLSPAFGSSARLGSFAGNVQEDSLYTRRLALLVGANDGGHNRPVLRFAVDDARAMGKVLEDMGGIPPGDSRYLENPDKAALFRTIKTLAADVDRARETFRRVEVILYYSGHSDEEALFLGEERVLYEEIKNLVTAFNADVRIAIFDSCASGALTLPKGVIKKPPFLLDTAYDMKGYAFMTSSSASEAAQESSRLGRSFFTHNLISGMRGAADMNGDGRITLNEAYQFAFDGTLIQTERTMAGAQHPSRHVQMSGTGDVVITDIRKSSAVLVFEPEFSGTIYIHNKAGLLLVELTKPAGREISIGLDAGEYRVFAVDETGALEAKISLAEGKSRGFGRSDFARAVRVPETVRGTPYPGFSGKKPRAGRFGWRIEALGGLAAIDPSDLNMRSDFDLMYDTYYGSDCLTYLAGQGRIASVVKTSYGKSIQKLKRAVPFGIRVRRSLARWLDVSIGFARFAGSRRSSCANQYEVTDLSGAVSVYTDRYNDYTLAVSGCLPTIGVHVGTDISSSLRLEAGFSGGPMFAECRYKLNLESTWPGDGSVGSPGVPETMILEEKGKGIGPAFDISAKLDYALTRKTGVFVEGVYAFQTIHDISGPGTRSFTGTRDSWEGEWGIKKMISVEPWGTGRFLWPSNGWDYFGGNWWRERDFKLDLSGFQLRMGIFFRF